MPPKKVLKETTSTSKDFDNTHTTDIGTSSSSVEQRLNKVTELTSTTYEAVINLEHKFTKTNESIEQTNP